MENAALPHGAFNADGAVYRVYNLLYQGQSHARSNLCPIVFGLVEGLEDVRKALGRYSFARIAHVHQQSLSVCAHLNAHRSLRRRVLKGVRQQVVHQLIHIVGHEIHLHFAAKVGCKVHFAHACIFAVALNVHGNLRHDVAVSPCRFAHGRLHFGYVEQLIDECKQASSLPFDGFCLLARVGRHVLVSRNGLT